MLPIGGRPLLEWLIDQLKSSNIRDILITTHYRPAKILDHFGDGEKFGVNIQYVHESTPRGTAGGLRLFRPPDHPILVVNADIFTNLHLRNMLDFHIEHEGEMTVAVRKYQTRVDYGVVESDGIKITGLIEKPVLDFFVNAGIYVLESSCFNYFPSSDRFDMTDLIGNLINSGRSVINFPIRESWLDIGQHSDYERAVRENPVIGEDR
jgi:NDP-sugar pyrophosphorylase family protein